MTYVVSVAARPSGRGKRGSEARSRMEGGYDSAAGAVLADRGLSNSSLPQLRRPSTEISQGHLGSRATSGGGQGYLSLHKGRLVE